MKTIKLIFTFSCLYFGTSSTISTSTEAEVATIEDTSNDEPFTDLLLIGTADGMLTAFDDKQNEKWTLDTGGSIATSYNIDDDDNHFSVHPGIDGNVYIGTRQGMTKTSVKARMIAEKAPFVSTQDNLFFTGQKTNRILGVDVRNGKIIHDSSIIGSKLSRGLDGSLITTRVDGSKRAPLWVGRTEYSFRAFDRDTGLEHFNLTYSEIGPLNSLASDDDAPASDLYDSLDPSDYGIRQQSLPSTLDKSTQLQKSYALDADRLSTFKGSPIVNSFSLNKLHAGDVHDTDTHELFSVKSLRINPLKLSGQPLRDPRFVDNTVGQDNKDFKKSFQEKSLQALPSGTEQFLINDVNSILGTESRTDESSPTRRKSTALTALRDSGPRSRSATVPLLKLRDDSTPTVLSLNQVALVDNNEDIGDDDSNGIPIDNDLIRSKERLLHGNNNGRLCVLKSNHNIGKEGDLMPICKSDSRLRPALLAGLSNVDDSGLPHFAQLKYYQSTFSEDLIKYRGFSRAYSNSDSKSKSVLRRILAIITELVASVLGLTIFTLFAVYILQRVGFLSIETTRDMYAAVMRLILLAYGDDALRLRISPSLVVEKSDNAEAIEEDDGFGGKITKVGSLVLTQHVLGYGRYVFLFVCI